METSLVKVCAWLWPPLLAQLQGLPGHLGMWQSRHFSEHRARLPKAQTKVTQQCHHFTNLWGAQELLIESFQELQVPFYWHSPHSSSSRVGWINASQSSSSIRYSQASPEYSTQGAWGKLSIEGSIFMMSENFSLVYPMPLGFFSNMFTLCLCLGVHFQSPHTEKQMRKQDLWLLIGDRLG